LDIPAVLQTQGAELVIAQFASQIAFELIAVLSGTGFDEL
jgi:hypothetical protein